MCGPFIGHRGLHRQGYRGRHRARTDQPRRYPADCAAALGNTNGSIVYTLVTDLIRNSSVPGPDQSGAAEIGHIGFSEAAAETLEELKDFNYRHIYLAPQTQKYMPLIKLCYQRLFDHYLKHLEDGTSASLDVDLLEDLDPAYIESQPAAARVRDFISGMTDDYFLRQAEAIGCASRRCVINIDSHAQLQFSKTDKAANQTSAVYNKKPDSPRSLDCFVLAFCRHAQLGPPTMNPFHLKNSIYDSQNSPAHYLIIL